MLFRSRQSPSCWRVRPFCRRTPRHKRRQATDTKAGDLTDIMVTASETEERLQGAAVAVTAPGSE